MDQQRHDITKLLENENLTHPSLDAQKTKKTMLTDQPSSKGPINNEISDLENFIQQLRRNSFRLVKNNTFDQRVPESDPEYLKNPEKILKSTPEIEEPIKKFEEPIKKLSENVKDDHSSQSDSMEDTDGSNYSCYDGLEKESTIPTQKIDHSPHIPKAKQGNQDEPNSTIQTPDIITKLRELDIPELEEVSHKRTNKTKSQTLKKRKNNSQPPKNHNSQEDQTD